MEQVVASSVTKYELYAQQLKLKQSGEDFNGTKQALRAIDQLRRLYDRRRVVENVMFAVGMIGICIMLIETELLFTQSQTLQVLQTAFYAHNLRVLNMVLTAILFLALCIRYHLQSIIDLAQHRFPDHKSVWASCPRLAAFLIEALICLFIIPAEYTQSVEMKEWRSFTLDHDCPSQYTREGKNCFFIYEYNIRTFGIFMLLRMYMIPRFVRNQSGFYSHRIAFVGTLNNVESLGPMFAVKCLLRSHPFRLLIPSFILVLLLTALSILFLEQPVNPSVASLNSALWLTIVTMSTIGYGDLVPMTLLGRIFMVFGGIMSGILLISMLNASFFAMIELTEKDHRVLFVLAQEQWVKEMHTESARLIQCAWDLYKDKNETSMHRLYQCAWRTKSLRQRKPVLETTREEILREIHMTTLHRMQQAHHDRLQHLRELNSRLEILLTRV